MQFQCALAGAPPPNDNFANRTPLFGATNLTASNVGAGIEAGEPQHAGEPGGHSVWWTWTADASGTVRISTAGSTFDTLLAVYFGSALDALTPIASNDDVGDDSTSTVLFRAIAGETYQIAVDGFQSAIGTIQLSVGPSGGLTYSWIFHDTNDVAVSWSNFPHRVVMLDFFETTCGDCILEAPNLAKLRNKYLAEGFDIIPVAKDNSSVSEICSNAARMGTDYNLVLNDPRIEAWFGNGGALPMPTKVLLDRERKWQLNITGGWTLDYYESLVVPLLHGAVNLPVNFRPTIDGLVLSWPDTEFGYVVEGSTNPSNSGNWTPLSTRTIETNEQNTVTVPTTNEAGFFRLRKSQP
jgi:thiol-disulfide isomerase/thioredoxin